MNKERNHEITKGLRGALQSVRVSEDLKKRTVDRVMALKKGERSRSRMAAFAAGLARHRRAAAAVLALVLCGGVLWSSVGVLAPVILEGSEGALQVRAGLRRFESFDALKAQLLKLKAMGGKHAAGFANGSWTADVAENALGSQKSRTVAPEQSTAGGAGDDYAKTNVQVQGVDEADIMRTDGRYLYIASKGRVAVVDTGGDVPVKLSEIALEDGGSIHEFYLLEDRLILITTGGNVRGVARTESGGAAKPGSAGKAEVRPSQDGEAGGGSDGADMAPDARAVPPAPPSKGEDEPGIAYASDTPAAEPGGNASDIGGELTEEEQRKLAQAKVYDGYRYVQMTGVRVYDISDPSKPVERREFSIEGSLLSSRITGGRLYLVTNKYLDSYAMGEDTDAADILTNYKDTAVGEDTCLVPAELITYLPAGQTQNLLSVATIDYMSDAAANIETVFGSGYILYMNQTSLYVTSAYYDEKNYESGTLIMKFDVTKDGVAYRCSAVVMGTALNQFSMDEHNGYFRIAVTRDIVSGVKPTGAAEIDIAIDRAIASSSNTENRVYVLDKDLKLTGKLSGIAPGERIKSVRFSGDVGYVVTFVQTDPLFVIDLSDPSAPKVRGELKIPGFSQYLHPVGDGLLLGIGQDTEVNEYGAAVTKGIKISLFDVKNPDNPKECNYIVIGGKGSSAVAEYDHRNFVWDAGRKTGMMTAYIADNYNYRGVQGLVVRVEESAVLLEKALNPYELGYGSQYYYGGYSKLIYIGDRLFLYDGTGLHVYDRKTYTHKYALDLEKGGALSPSAYGEDKVYPEKGDVRNGATTESIAIYD